MSDYSIYSFEDEIKNGFITLKGGFRVGITGQVIVENEKIISIKNISSLNIRICREIIGCSKKILNNIYSDKLNNTMIISPPNCGKTTFLRDIIYQLSIKNFNVGVVDERSEIGGTYMGIIQNNLGSHTDILDRCPKVLGMNLLLRSMSPDVIAIDEISTLEDVLALEKVSNSGVNIICTIHGESIEDVLKKDILKNIINKNIFKRFIVISRRDGAGTIEGVFDEKLCLLK